MGKWGSAVDRADQAQRADQEYVSAVELTEPTQLSVSVLTSEGRHVLFEPPWPEEEPDALQPDGVGESGIMRSVRALPSAASAWERGLCYLNGLNLLERRTADGLRVGIQSTLATDAHGSNSIDLRELADELRSAPLGSPQPADPVRGLWHEVAGYLEHRLGFLLEPELFSNMLFCAHVSCVDDERIRALAAGLLRTFNRSDAAGLYHFFTSLRFACDIDCTGVAVRARLAMGDIDLRTPAGAAALRKSTERILRTAAVADIHPASNQSHFKDNGELRRLVFKVYPDDHEVQGAVYDRGLKNDALVVINAIQCVLEELRAELRSPDEVIQLKEFLQGRARPRTGRASVAEIVAANLRYVSQHLADGSWRQGTRYYASPDAFLFCFADLLWNFPELLEMAPGLHGRLRSAVHERSKQPDRGSLDLALNALAAQKLGADPSSDLDRLIALQDADGGWTDFCPLFRLGSRSPQIFFGSSAQNTAFAIRALSGASSVRLSDITSAHSSHWLSPVAECWNALRSLR